MFSFLKKAMSNVATSRDPICFVGKCPLDNEHLKFGKDALFVNEKDIYLMKLKSYLDRRDSKGNKLRYMANVYTSPSRYFFSYHKKKSEAYVGRWGGNRDKSHREYPYIFTRKIVNANVKKYPLFIPLLYDEFYKASDTFLSLALAGISVTEYESMILSQNQSSFYENKSDVLTTAMNGLYHASLDDYYQSLPQPQLIKRNDLMAVWCAWQEVLSVEEDKAKPLIFELPFNDNLHHYVAFLLQLIEPWFDYSENFQVSWWVSNCKQQAWCLIYNGDTCEKTELLTFHSEWLDNALLFTHSVEKKESQLPCPGSLFEALKIISE
jgi:hypothetical protein